MKVLVTGGAGYIGSHVVYELIKNNHSVVVLDDLSTGNREAVHQKAKFYQGDQQDKNILNKIFIDNQIDVVMHFSAKLIVPESVSKPLKYFENNVCGMVALLQIMKKHNIKNIIFSSTAAVYGIPKHNPIQEDDLKNPINPYGQSKLACEWIIEATAKAHNMNYVIFRYFNVAGADDSGNIGQATKGMQSTHLIPVVIEALSGIRKKMSLFGTNYDTRDGSCLRDYIHVQDLAKAHVLGAEYAMKGKSNIFNLGSKKGFTVKEIILNTQKIFNKKIPYEIKDRRLGDPDSLVASNDKAIKELRFKVTKSLKDMINSDYKWRNNKKF